jgi:hypothetical protein
MKADERMIEQQESHLFACGSGQHLLTGVGETATIADRVLRLLIVVQAVETSGVVLKMYGRLRPLPLIDVVPSLPEPAIVTKGINILSTIQRL